MQRFLFSKHRNVKNILKNISSSYSVEKNSENIEISIPDQADVVIIGISYVKLVLHKIKNKFSFI